MARLEIARKESPLVQLSDDAQIRQITDALTEAKQSLNALDLAVREACGERPGFVRRGIRAMIRKLVPREIRQRIGILAREDDALNLIEYLMRKNLNGVQKAIVWLAEMGEEVNRRAQELDQMIETARRECWDATRILAAIAEHGGVRLATRVEQMLGVQLSLLTESQRADQRERLLDALTAEISLGQELRLLLENVGNAGLTVFGAAMTQFHGYVSVARPVAVLRDAANSLVEVNQSSLVARAALEETVRRSIYAVEAVIEATSLAEAYAISSPEMKALLTDGRCRVDAKLALLLPERPKDAPITT